MASLTTLPRELEIQIFKHLSQSDKYRLTLTCQRYRRLLLPEIFKTMRLTNNDKLARTVLAAIEAHGMHTQCIIFNCHTSLHDIVHAPALPPAASKILQGHLTPNLHTVQLEFKINFNEVRMWDPTPHFPQNLSIQLFQTSEDMRYVREQENIRSWRALMNETWQALSANRYVRKLILRKFIPKWTSTFHTHEFRQFLSHIEDININILDLEDFTRRKTNTMDGYREFLANLDAPFFHHMIGLKYLRIWGKDPLGLEGRRYIPLALKPTDLPILESLRLDCFVGPELVSFIQGHTHCLKFLHLNDCVSAGSGHGMAINAMSWAEFFDEVREAKPVLKKLIAGRGFVPLTDDEAFEPEIIRLDEPEEVQDVRQKLKDNPNLRLFGYGHLNRNGTFLHDGDSNIGEFNKGDDQRAYDRLMGLVKQNVAEQE